MHFRFADREVRLLAGSSDVNFNLDFDRYAALPAPPACATYHGLLSAVQGLTQKSQWYDPMRHAPYRIREFVVANMDADQAHNIAYVASNALSVWSTGYLARPVSFHQATLPYGGVVFPRQWSALSSSPRFQVDGAP